MKKKRICKDCGADITFMHFNCVRCETCQFYYEKNKRRKAALEWKKRKFGEHKKMTKLGTTDFSAHANPDFDQEARLISNELKKLGLRK